MIPKTKNEPRNNKVAEIGIWHRVLDFLRITWLIHVYRSNGMWPQRWTLCIRNNWNVCNMYSCSATWCLLCCLRERNEKPLSKSKSQVYYSWVLFNRNMLNMNYTRIRIIRRMPCKIVKMCCYGNTYAHQRKLLYN